MVMRMTTMAISVTIPKKLALLQKRTGCLGSTLAIMKKEVKCLPINDHCGRELFAQAKEAPSIIFIDEIDAVAKSRDGKYQIVSNDKREQILNQLLTEKDGFDGNSAVIVLGASNRSDVLDPALSRPGRFDRVVMVDCFTGGGATLMNSFMFNVGLILLCSIRV